MVRIQKGDATIPVTDGKVIIAHICNNVNAWGRGFVVPLGKAYPKAKAEFHMVSQKFEREELLGKIQVISITDTLSVANMFAQDGLRSRANPVPLQMSCLETCLAKLFQYAKNNNAVVQMPPIGSGLGGGDWNEIFKLIEEMSSKYSVDCWVLEL